MVVFTCSSLYHASDQRTGVNCRPPERSTLVSDAAVWWNGSLTRVDRRRYGPPPSSCPLCRHDWHLRARPTSRPGVQAPGPATTETPILTERAIPVIWLDQSEFGEPGDSCPQRRR